MFKVTFKKKISIEKVALQVWHCELHLWEFIQTNVAVRE